MPLNNLSNLNGKWVAGVDGCTRGWVVFAQSVATGDSAVAMLDSFAPVLDLARFHDVTVVVDMPIGLPDMGRRACETVARSLLGNRRSSVFSAPRRPMLGFKSYLDANSWGKNKDPAGLGLSKQAWNIMPKIREIDGLICPADQNRVFEGHPEVAFTRLGRAPCRHSKKTAEGALEREAILSAHGIDVDKAKKKLRAIAPLKRDVKEDDLLDAAVLSVTAKDILANKAVRLGDGLCDAKGLIMEIHG